MIKSNTEKIQQQHRRKTLWHRIISVLSAITVFITTYALILPAITMEPAAGILVDQGFYYENEKVKMIFQVEGRAAFAEDVKQESLPAGSEISLQVTPLSEESSARQQYEAYAKEQIGEDLQDLLTMRLTFTYENLVLDMSGCQIQVEIQPKTEETISGLNRLPQKLEGMGTMSGSTEKTHEVTALTAFQGIGKDLAALDTAFLSGETDSLHTTLYGTTMAVALYSTVNPSFTVQYYTYFTVLDTEYKSGYVGIDVIDTTGGVLPQNGKTPATKDVYLKKDGTNRYVMATKQQLAPVYTQQSFQYIQAPTTAYMDRLRANPNFELSEVWVLKTGKNATSTNRNDWNIYPGTVSFTNRESSATSTRIYIPEGAVIRFVYDEIGGSYTNPVNFYDYDITNGKIYNENGREYNTSRQNNNVWYARTDKQGINSFAVKSGTAAFAYGNVNTNSGYGDQLWNGNSLNAYNRSGGGFDGCTFGMVVGFNDDGTLKFASGISAPKMFGDSTQTGKTKIDGMSLQFERVGDTYVLTSVNNSSTTGLQYFNNPGYTDNSGNSILHSHIYTNNFWPMDSAWTYGANGHDLKFGSASLLENRRLFAGSISNGSKALPVGDDGKDHNSYFGMNYEITFTLTADYVGPLDYMFYGDDDMWVFLDGKLICDIGGVHSSVGQYVDLWDYLEKGSEGDHTLTFYYTERGASGSTCYMQFTLPSVDTDTPQVQTNTLELGKQVLNSNTDREFRFVIDLKDADGNPLVDDYSYTRYDAAGVAIENGILNSENNVVYLRGGEKLTVDYLPDGTQFVVTEETVAGFATVYSINGGTNVESITASGTVNGDVTILYVNATSVILPSTGGFGITWYLLPILLGIGVMILAPLAETILNKKNKKKNNNLEEKT